MPNMVNTLALDYLNRVYIIGPKLPRQELLQGQSRYYSGTEGFNLEASFEVLEESSSPDRTSVASSLEVRLKA